ncbi:hypothetical protein ACP70R_015803 [Stipagrostis hirtigluma subsp. patula]
MEAFGAGEKDPACVQAARILLSLRKRRLQRCPEWASPVEAGVASAAVAEEVEVAFPTAVRTKGPRSRRLRLPGDWKASLAVLKDVPVGAARSGGEERERSRERQRARPGAADALVAPARGPTTPAYHVVHAGSGPSTSADSAARPHPRPRSGDKASAVAAKAAVAAPPKEPMSASSPETPLDFGGGAAGSGASSSWDDAARRPPKRRSPGARGSGGASSGDEGCSSPAKRPRVSDAGGEAAVGEKEISEPKTPGEPSTNGGDKEVKFMFDLNIPWTDDCSDAC